MVNGSEAGLTSDTMGDASAGLYVHVPFCSSVCPYCDFAVTIAGEERRDGWRKAVGAEAQMFSRRGWTFETVYLGGGTPSILTPEAMAEVVDTLGAALSLSEASQFFLEINPEDAVPANIRAWKDLGFSFASVGLQSPDKEALRFLGRRHTPNQGKTAIRTLKAEGFSTVSADLIFGLAGQTTQDWRRQLEAVVALGVDHLSCYQLTIHDGTIFGRRQSVGVLHEAGNDLQAELFSLTHAVLVDAGFEHYEVSSYARTGHRSRHNEKYWTGVPYLGLGPGSHSFDGVGRRWWNRRKLRLWQRDVEEGRSPTEGAETLSAEELAFEALMLGLRRSDGVDLEDVERRLDVAVIELNRRNLDRMAEDGLIEVVGNHIRPTARGMAVADGLARELEVVGRAVQR